MTIWTYEETRREQRGASCVRFEHKYLAFSTLDAFLQHVTSVLAQYPPAEHFGPIFTLDTECGLASISDPLDRNGITAKAVRVELVG